MLHIFKAAFEDDANVGILEKTSSEVINQAEDPYIQVQFDAIEDAQEQEYQDNANRLFEIVPALEDIHSQLNRLTAQGIGFNPSQAAMLKIATETIVELGFKKKIDVIPNRQAFGGTMSKKEGTILAAEGIKETANNAFTIMVNAIKRILDYVVKKVEELFSIKKEVNKKCSNYEDDLKEIIRSGKVFKDIEGSHITSTTLSEIIFFNEHSSGKFSKHIESGLEFSQNLVNAIHASKAYQKAFNLADTVKSSKSVEDFKAKLLQINHDLSNVFNNLPDSLKVTTKDDEYFIQPNVGKSALKIGMIQKAIDADSIFANGFKETSLVSNPFNNDSDEIVIVSPDELHKTLEILKKHTALEDLKEKEMMEQINKSIDSFASGQTQAPDDYRKYMNTALMIIKVISTTVRASVQFKQRLIRGIDTYLAMCISAYKKQL